MSIIRFDPFRDLDRMAHVLTHHPGARQSAVSGGMSASMPMDAYREGDQFIVHFDLPGVDPAAIDLTAERNVLTVRAERRWPQTENQELIIAERPQGTFTRQLFLGESLDAEKIEASYAHGVLTVTIPVREQAKPRRVEVNAGDAAGHHTISVDSDE